MIYIVMGVAGCGKSTIGEKLADHLQLPFYDADDFHPKENVIKMNQGIPLNDDDRLPWLKELGSNIIQWEKNGGAVLACSALKEKYRQILESIPSHQVQWIYLEGSKELILQRLKQRNNHYMPASLLDSQFEALEKPAYGIHTNISQSPDLIINEILKKLNKMQTLSEFGIIGLGVMGKSLALNLAEKKSANFHI